MRRRTLIALTARVAFQPLLCRAQGTYQEEADRLAVLLDWQPTSTVADIGTGHGQLSLAAAKRVGKICSSQNPWNRKPAL
ncbi:MAG: hypothetical protein ABSH52_31320 [Terriglobia bacterium]|jgi:protein-L-isoaspartate O-methyltransferase